MLWVWAVREFRWARLTMNRSLATGTPCVVEVTQHRHGASSLLKLQMLVGSVFGFLFVVAIGVASADDTPTSNPVLPEIELAPAVVVAAGVDSIDTNAVTRLTAESELGIQIGTAFRLDDGRIATVTHAVLNATEVGLSGGETFLAVDPDEINSSRLHDLTTLRNEAVGPSLPIASRPSGIGESVAVAGIAANNRIEVVTGEIIDRTDGVAYGIGRPDVYALSVEVGEGWSGGPVVNAFGEVIAVIVGSETTTGVTIAVPIEYLPEA